MSSSDEEEKSTSPVVTLRDMFWGEVINEEWVVHSSWVKGPLTIRMTYIEYDKLMDYQLAAKAFVRAFMDPFFDTATTKGAYDIGGVIVCELVTTTKYDLPIQARVTKNNETIFEWKQEFGCEPGPTSILTLSATKLKQYGEALASGTQSLTQWDKYFDWSKMKDLRDPDVGFKEMPIKRFAAALKFCRNENATKDRIDKIADSIPEEGGETSDLAEFPEKDLHSGVMEYARWRGPHPEGSDWKNALGRCVLEKIQNAGVENLYNHAVVLGNVPDAAEVGFSVGQNYLNDCARLLEEMIKARSEYNAPYARYMEDWVWFLLGYTNKFHEWWNPFSPKKSLLEHRANMNTIYKLGKTIAKPSNEIIIMLRALELTFAAENMVPSEEEEEGGGLFEMPPRHRASSKKKPTKTFSKKKSSPKKKAPSKKGSRRV